MDPHTFTSKYQIDMGSTFPAAGSRAHEPINYFINIDYLNYPYEVISSDSSDERLLEIAESILNKKKSLAFTIDEIVSDLQHLRHNLH